MVQDVLDLSLTGWKLQGLVSKSRDPHTRIHALIAMPLRSVSAIMSLTMKPEAVACRQ